MATLVLSAASARVDSVSFTAMGPHPAVRIALAGQPAGVTLDRGPGTARITLTDAALGLRFGGAHRAVWIAGARASPRWIKGGSRVDWLDRIDVEARANRVSLMLRSSRATGMVLRRDAQGILLVLDIPPARAPALQGPQTPTEPASPQASREGHPQPVATPHPTAAGERPRPIVELYPQLFPPEPEEPPAPSRAATVPADDVTIGPFRLRASVEGRYVSADTFLESAEPQRDEYLEIDPRVGFDVPIGAARLSLDYTPALRGLATYRQVNSNSHIVAATAALPLGRRVSLRLHDSFAAGTLDTRLVDPGGEYFFRLGRFRRNDAAATATIAVGARTSLELAGGLGSLRFQEPSSFVGYDRRQASAGLVFELTPTLKGAATYRYELVPQPSNRPEAESRAHSATLSFTGDISPLLSGELALGYRRQQNPHVVDSGHRYSGLTFSGVLTRRLTPRSTLSLQLARSTPVSAYAGNGFYVSTALEAALEVPLVSALYLRGGIGRRWNDYRVATPSSPELRRDRILSWYATLRCPVRRGLSLNVSYRSEHRSSNSALFQAESSAVLLQIGWNMFGRATR